MNPERMYIGRLLADREPFVVPTYQRGYAWEQSEIDDFIGDINALFQSKQHAITKTHFLGGIVTIQQPAPGTKQGFKYEVVDGQQRLSTFFLTISLIVQALKRLEKDAAKSHDEKAEKLVALDEKEIRTEYLYYSQIDDRTAEEKHYRRLTLSKVDDGYFSTLVGNDPKKHSRSAPSSHKRLYKAYTLIRDNLVFPILSENISLIEKRDKLKTLKECILRGCYIIFIWSTDTDEAHQLFSILNDRGKSLSNGDLLRSYTLQILEGYEPIQKQVEDHWDTILSPATRQIDGFLGSYYPSHKGIRSPNSDLFRDFRRDVLGNLSAPISSANAVEVEKCVNSFREEQEVYMKIISYEWPYESTTLGMWERDRLNRLVRTLRHDLCIPLLMSACMYLPETIFYEMLCLLERFVFRYIIIVGSHANPLRDIYYAHSVKIRSGVVYNLSDLENELKALGQSKASDDVFRTLLDEGELDYSEKATQQKNYIRHFLITLEDYSEWFERNKTNKNVGKPKPNSQLSFIDIEKATIEHIYPQKANVKDNKLEKLINDIGNLALLSDGTNSSLGNRSFSHKRTEYAKLNVSLSRELADQTTWREPQPNVVIDPNVWTDESVNERRKRLIDMAMMIFKL
jgi:uncharacterized protein with ParB-like and HNH nuclease domain